MPKRKTRKKQYQFNEHDENQVQLTLKRTKQKKRKRRIRRITFVLVVILLAAFFISPASRIKSIKVEGNDIVSSDDIIQKSKLSTKTVFPYSFVTQTITKDHIKELAMIDSVSIQYDFIGNVKIKVKESEAIASGTIGKKTYIVDRNGKVCETTNADSLTGLTQISDFKKLKMFKRFCKEYVKIPLIIRNDVSDVVYSPQKKDTTRVALKLDDGKIFYVRIEDMADQLDNFDYDAYMQAYGDRCIFSFEGDNLFMKKCYSNSNSEEESTSADTENN